MELRCQQPVGKESKSVFNANPFQLPFPSASQDSWSLLILGLCLAIMSFADSLRSSLPMLWMKCRSAKTLPTHEAFKEIWQG